MRCHWTPIILLLSRHLIKCAKNKALLKNFTSCEYNHTHKIKRGDGSKHYKRCEEKRRIVDGWNVITLCTKKCKIQIAGENLDDELESFVKKKVLWRNS